MLTVIIQVPEQRERASFVAIEDGFRTLIADTAVATSALATKSGAIRGDHPPLGRYELTARAATPSDAGTEYGDQLLLFEPIAGPALEAESYGRFGVLLYAGSAGRDMFLRRTQGGVRLSGRAMEVLLANIPDDNAVALEIENLAPPPWWAFWRKRRTPPSLSADPPRFMTPPYDEATLADRLLRSAIRRERTGRRRDDDDDDRWRDRDSPSGSSRDASTDYRGGGGSGGGGGATGAWADTSAAGRGPGVTSAGIVLGAAGIAAVAAAAAEQESASSASIDTPSSDSTGDSGSAGADSGSADTTTGTAY